MLKTFTVTVTQAHIDRGRRGTMLCPIMFALQQSSVTEEFPSGANVLVSDIAWEDCREGAVYPLPNAAKKFIRRFDAGQPVEPCEIEFRYRTE